MPAAPLLVTLYHKCMNFRITEKTYQAAMQSLGWKRWVGGQGGTSRVLGRALTPLGKATLVA